MAAYATFPGIRSYGEGNTDLLTDPLEALGHQVQEMAYPRRHVWSANRWTRRTDAKLALDQLKHFNARVGVSHSRGSDVLLEVAKHHEFELLVMVRPAIRRKRSIDELLGYPTVICLYSKADLAVRLGKYLSWATVFGSAGVHGMKTPGVINVQMSGLHSADFRPPQIDELVRLLDDPFPTLASFQESRVWSFDAHSGRRLRGVAARSARRR